MFYFVFNLQYLGMDSEVECVWESEDKVVTGNDTGIRNCRDEPYLLGHFDNAH